LTSKAFVFIREDGGPYTDKNLNLIWLKACNDAGVGKIKLYNAIRHSLGCQLLDLGVPMYAVQKVLGHSRPEMTKRYAARTTDAITQMLERRTAMVLAIRSKQPVCKP